MASPLYMLAGLPGVSVMKRNCEVSHGYLDIFLCTRPHLLVSPHFGQVGINGHLVVTSLPRTSSRPGQQFICTCFCRKSIAIGMPGWLSQFKHLTFYFSSGHDIKVGRSNPTLGYVLGMESA